MPIACGEILVVALPGTLVRVQWIFENGAIEHERVYQRSDIHLSTELSKLQKENADLRLRMKPDAAFF